MDQNKFYGLIFGFIISDSISSKYNVHISNRKIDLNKDCDFNATYHTRILLKILKILYKNKINENNLNMDLIVDKLYIWFNKGNYKNIHSSFALAMNNYKINGKYIGAKNIFTDYFGLIYTPIYILFKDEKMNIYNLTHSMSIYKLLTNLIFFYSNDSKKSIPNIFIDIINDPFVGSSDAFETVRCAIKAFNETDNFFDGLVLILNSVESVQPSAIIYGIIAGNYYGLTGIFNKNFDIKKLNNYKAYLDIIDLCWDLYK